MRRLFAGQLIDGWVRSLRIQRIMHG